MPIAFRTQVGQDAPDNASVGQAQRNFRCAHLRNVETLPCAPIGFQNGIRQRHVERSSALAQGIPRAAPDIAVTRSLRVRIEEKLLALKNDRVVRLVITKGIKHAIGTLVQFERARHNHVLPAFEFDDDRRGLADKALDKADDLRPGNQQPRAELVSTRVVRITVVALAYGSDLPRLSVSVNKERTVFHKI